MRLFDLLQRLLLICLRAMWAGELGCSRGMLAPGVLQHKRNMPPEPVALIFTCPKRVLTHLAHL
jgi:hypothetical protein